MRWVFPTVLYNRCLLFTMTNVAMQAVTMLNLVFVLVHLIVTTKFAYVFVVVKCTMIACVVLCVCFGGGASEQMCGRLPWVQAVLCAVVVMCIVAWLVFLIVIRILGGHVFLSFHQI